MTLLENSRLPKDCPKTNALAYFAAAWNDDEERFKQLVTRYMFMALLENSRLPKNCPKTNTPAYFPAAQNGEEERFKQLSSGLYSWPYL